MKVVIQSPVAHDGKMLEVGDEVDMQKADAEALIACGAAELLVGKKSAKEAKAEAEAAKAKADAAAAVAAAQAAFDEAGEDDKAAAELTLTEAQEALAALG